MAGPKSVPKYVEKCQKMTKNVKIVGKMAQYVHSGDGGISFGKEHSKLTKPNKTYSILLTILSITQQTRQK
jgi:hypothetical protein